MSFFALYLFFILFTSFDIDIPNYFNQMSLISVINKGFSLFLSKYIYIKMKKEKLQAD